MYDLGELWKEFRKELSEELLKEFQNKLRTEAFQNEVVWPEFSNEGPF